MRIVEINTFLFGSTGGIMRQTAALARQHGAEVWVSAQADFHKLIKPDDHTIQIGSVLGLHVAMELSKHFGCGGTYNRFATARFLRKLDKINPDILHLHNLHTCYLNLEMLFTWIKKRKNLKVIWTLHDCWSFTGHCPHFLLSGCDKWKTGCFDCPSYGEYPVSRVDDSRKMYALKQKWFTGVQNMTLVTPSQWLNDLTRQSFLKEYPCITINNGIDLNVFKPCVSEFRAKHGLENKYVVLGVAFDWGPKKGLDVMIRLSECLGENYQIVLVGTNDSIDAQLPDNIISIHRTVNQQELAEIYTAADVFVSPTREDNYPTVNMEAMACGTPVVVFDIGGAGESVRKGCGIVIPLNDEVQMELAVRKVCEEKPFLRDMCVESAQEFRSNRCLQQYLQLYFD